jgi:tape measure domain-containing protein
VEGGAEFMSGSTDERIVDMQFNSTTFIQDIKNTVTALNNLKTSLTGLHGASSDLSEIDTAAKSDSISKMASGVESLASKFSALGVIGLTALSNIVNRAVGAGIDVAKALLIDPIKEGFQNYETKINAIQTVLANTAAAGTTLNQVTAALAQLNVYANKTVYNFSEMAQNVGTFTAAGVGLSTAVSSIKGIANLAALSGSSAQQATSAMYQLSQAIASGRVKLQDWNSVVNAGLGGKTFQTALINTARNQGVAIDQLIKKTGSFRQSLQSGWLTSKILTDTLDQFTGDLTNKQLKAMGYTQAQIVAIQKEAAIAVKSATQVRTLTQLQQDLTEEVGTAYATIWGTLIGNITNATAVLSKVHTTLENAFTNPLYAFNAILVQFVKLGGRDEVIQAISDGFKNLAAILKIVESAFREVFPPLTALTLVKMAVALEEFTESLRLSKQGATDLKDTLVGVFSIIKIGIDIIIAIFKGITQMTGAAKGAGGSVLSLTGRLGDFINNVRKSIEDGGKLNTFFVDLGKILALPIKALTEIVDGLGGFAGVIGKVISVIAPFTNDVETAFSGLAGAIVKGIESGNFNTIATLVNQVLLGGVLVSIKKFITNLGKGSGEEKTGFLDTIKESFEGLTNSLKTMQSTLKAKTLEEIAAAVAILSVSLIALSFVNEKNLAKAVAAITGMFLDLIGALTLLTKAGAGTGVVKMIAIAGALNLFATAIVILAGAVAILAQFSLGQLAKGIATIAALLAEFVAATALLGGNAKGLVATAYSMEIMGVALTILATAVGKFGKLDVGTLAKGLSAIAAVLAELTLFNTFGGKQSVISAAAMVVLASALLIIGKAIAQIGSLPIDTLIKGITAIAGALAEIAAAVLIMPPTLPLTAAGLLVISAALLVIAKAISTIGALSWTAIVKGLTGLAGALALIVLAMIGMEGALPGALALVVVAGALAILTPVLVALSQLGWEGIAIALVALAGAFVVIGAAGILLGPLIPVLLGVGAAITLMGVGLLAAGAGIALFAVGLSALAVAFTASGVATLAFVGSMLQLIPTTFSAIGKGIVAFAVAIGQGAPALVAAFVAILTSLLDGIIKVTPIIVTAFGVIMNGILQTIPKYAPRVVSAIINLLLTMLDDIAAYAGRFSTAAGNLLVNFLNGIAREVPRVAQAAGNIVIAFINAIGAQTARVDQAGVQMIIHFINTTASQIRADAPELHSAGVNLAEALIQGVVIGIAGGIPSIIGAAENMAESAFDAAKNFLKSHSPSRLFRDEVGAMIPAGTVIGINSGIGDVSSASENMANQAFTAAKTALSGVNDALSDTVNLNPTITPVLDLTQAQKGFNQLSNISKSQLLSTSTATNKATSISAGNTAAAAAVDAATGNVAPGVTYNQYNTSPVALSASTIYRQTKNQLSVQKGALTGNANTG